MHIAAFSRNIVSKRDRGHGIINTTDVTLNLPARARARARTSSELTKLLSKLASCDAPCYDILI